MKSQKLLSCALALGMLTAAAFNLAQAQDINSATPSNEQTQQGGQQQNGNGSGQSAQANSVAISSGIPEGEGGAAVEEDEMSSGSSYPTSSSSNSSYSAGEDANAAMMEQLNDTVTVDNTLEVVETGITPEEPEAIHLTYPTFTQEEINQLFNVVDNPVDNAIGVIDPAEGSTEENGKLNYVEETAQLYRHVGVNPVYTYGKDEGDQGSCAGTSTFCEKSAQMWEEFSEKVGDKQPITDEESNQLIMPVPYSQNVANQPRVRPMCPEGYTPYPYGNEAQGVPGAHCGQVAGPNGNLYNMKPIEY